MAQTFPRNHFLEILRDPLAMTILSSIALHALLGAYLLPFITRPQPEGKKTEPNTVKVVELTPSELQRIPNTPVPLPTPRATQPTLPPVYQPSQPVAPKAPKVAPTPVIPTTPVRTPTPKAPTAAKSRSTPSPSTGGIFDPSAFPTNPFDPVLTPQPTKPPAKKGVTVKPKPKPKPKLTPSIDPASRKPTPPAKKSSATPKPTIPVASSTDDDGGEQGSAIVQPTRTPKPNQQSGSPATTPAASPNPSSTPNQPSNSAGAEIGSQLKYIQAANARINKYKQDHPGIVEKQLSLKLKYPPNSQCNSKITQLPLFIFLIAFDKVPKNQNRDVLGESTAPSMDEISVFGSQNSPENKKLAKFATEAALYEANKVDQTRAEIDKDKPVLYKYQINFDSTSCQK